MDDTEIRMRQRAEDCLENRIPPLSEDCVSCYLSNYCIELKRKRENRCPKCGEEMRELPYFTENKGRNGWRKSLSIKRVCKCGYEEKVKV